MPQRFKKNAKNQQQSKRRKYQPKPQSYTTVEDIATAETDSNEPPEQMSTKVDPNEQLTKFEEESAQSEVSHDKQRRLCKFFMRGFCRNQRCTFLHDTEVDTTVCLVYTLLVEETTI
jgi:hypothetical protein